MAKDCSCKNLDSHTIGELDTNAVLTEGGILVSSYGGFYAGEMLTENVTTLKENKLISGGVKVSAALGLPLLMPTMFENRFVRAFTVGFGVSGGKDLVEGLQIPKTGELNEWENYDRNNYQSDNGGGVRVDA